MTYISYNEFETILQNAIDNGKDFYLTFLEKIIDNPENYCGHFQCITTKTKVIQGIAQSYSIRFGKFLEQLTKEYLAKFGCKNLDTRLTLNRRKLECDQLFEYNGCIYLVEQKIRDNHDSTKKRGQFANFEAKIQAVMNGHHNTRIICGMWFIDDCFDKNRAEYNRLINEIKDRYAVTICLWYGGEFFCALDKNDAWDEYVSRLEQYQKEGLVEIPEFGSDRRILEALRNLPKNKWKKLNSDEQQFKILREELFSNGENLKIAKAERNK